MAVEPVNPGELVPSQLQPSHQVKIVTWVRKNIHVKKGKLTRRGGEIVSQ